jgi:hypothetical protein
MNADRMWSREPDIAAWLERARLNASRGLRQRAAEAQVQEAMKRFTRNVRPAMGKLMNLIAQAAAG